MDTFKNYALPYKPDPKYAKRVAYFSMEFAVAQPLKIYSGGLGFLAGSHMRSAYDLKQNLVGIGILWKYGYYDQVRNPDQTMHALFQEKVYSYLQDTGIKFQIEINRHPVFVKAWYLAPEVFGSAPLFLLSTDLPENDYLAQTTSHRLYDADKAARIAQYVLLGIGGAKLLDLLNFTPDVYHFNEAHALASAFYLYEKHENLAKLKKQIVFTTHTPEEAGNEKTDIRLLDKMSFFGRIPLDKVREITGVWEDTFNHTLVALRLAGIANGVSKIHGAVANRMWRGYEGLCKIKSITNAQNYRYWADPALNKAVEKDDMKKFVKRKHELKQELFEVVADQTGQLFDPNVLTVVWARRFAGYKRADLITQTDQALQFITESELPIQIIWAGKPYPQDYEAVSMFNKLVHFSKKYKNIAVLVGYELKLSALLKKGADVWLNNPRITREASGTSGMTAAMNGAINFSTYDGWIPEFAEHGKNAFVVPEVDITLPLHEQDQLDLENILKVFRHEVLPLYYNRPEEWFEMVKNSMRDILPTFDSDRMADQYYKEIYNF
jgi:starch phosphorylase